MAHNKKKKEPKSEHWPIRIKTVLVKNINKDIKEGKYENKSEAVNGIIADHYGIKLTPE